MTMLSELIRLRTVHADWMESTAGVGAAPDTTEWTYHALAHGCLRLAVRDEAERANRAREPVGYPPSSSTPRETVAATVTERRGYGVPTHLAPPCSCGHPRAYHAAGGIIRLECSACACRCYERDTRP